MTDIRDIRLYAEEDPDPSNLTYPFSYTGDEDYELIPRPIIGHDSAPIENFPNNIDTYYWTHEGENDVETWYCLCKLTNGTYVFYTASCDYTGFDCQGGMDIWSSYDPAVLIQYAMGEYDYELYNKECTVLVI